MAFWVVSHNVSGAVVAEERTKKSAIAVADEMTRAHQQIDAHHEGQLVSFVVSKAEELVALPVEEPAT